MTGTEQDQTPAKTDEAEAGKPIAPPAQPEPGHGAGGDPLTEGP